MERITQPTPLLPHNYDSTCENNNTTSDNNNNTTSNFVLNNCNNNFVLNISSNNIDINDLMVHNNDFLINPTININSSNNSSCNNNNNSINNSIHHQNSQIDNSIYSPILYDNENIDIRNTVNNFLNSSLDQLTFTNNSSSNNIITRSVSSSNNNNTSTTVINNHYNTNNQNIYSGTSRSISSISLQSNTTTKTNNSTPGFYLTPISSSSSLSDISSVSNNSSTDMSMGTLYNGNQGGCIIDFSNRELFKVPQRLPCEKDRIESLICSFNKITIIPEDFFLNFNLLVTLNFENNRIKNLPKSIKSLSTLQNVRLSNNKIKKFPKIFLSMPQLLTIDMANNKIESIPKDIHLINNLRELYLSNNQIQVIPIQITELTLILFSIDNNPLIYPPKDICDQGFESVIDFINDEIICHNSFSNKKSQNKSKNSNGSITPPTPQLHQQLSNNSLNNGGSNNSTPISSPSTSNNIISNLSVSPNTERRQNSNNNNNNNNKNQLKVSTSKMDSNKLFTAKGDSMVIQSTPTAITNTYYTPRKAKPSKLSKSSSKDIKNLIEIQYSLLQTPEVKPNNCTIDPTTIPTLSIPIPNINNSNCNSNNSTPTNQSTSPILDRIKMKIQSSPKEEKRIVIGKKISSNTNSPVSIKKSILSQNQQFNTIGGDSNSCTSSNEISFIEIEDYLLNVDQDENVSINNGDQYPTVEQFNHEHQTFNSSTDSLERSEESFNNLPPLSSDNSKFNDIHDEILKLSSNSISLTDEVSLDNSNNSIQSSISTNSSVYSQLNATNRALQSSKSSKSFFNSKQQSSQSNSSNNSQIISPCSTGTNSSSSVSPSSTFSPRSSIRSSQQVFQKVASVLSFTKPLTKSFNIMPNTISHSYSKPQTNNTNFNSIHSKDDIEILSSKTKQINKNSDDLYLKPNNAAPPTPSEDGANIEKSHKMLNSSESASELLSANQQHHIRERRGTTSEMDLKTFGSVKVLNLIDIIRDESSREHFKSFLITEFSQENLEFYLKIEDYRALTDVQRSLEATLIYQHYITDGSTNQINLPNICVKRIKESMNNSIDDNQNSIILFDEAQQHIFKLMEMDSFERFKKSTLYYKCQSPSTSNLKFNNLKQLLI